MTTLLIPYGLDDDDRIVHVDTVPRGKACGARCAGCAAALVARKGDKNIHHFAHLSTNGHGCEGWLHKTAKRILSQRITDAIAGGSTIPICWTCPISDHKVDLLGKRILNGIRVEQHLPTWNIKPDITLMAGDTAKGLIEVVDTHPPEQAVIDAGLPVLEVHVSKPADLDILAEGIIPVEVIHNYPCPDSCEKDRVPSGVSMSGWDRCCECGEEIRGVCATAYITTVRGEERESGWYCNACFFPHPYVNSSQFRTFKRPAKRKSVPRNRRRDKYAEV